MNSILKMAFILFVCINFFSCKDEYSICVLPTDVRVSANFFRPSVNNELPVSAPNLNISLLNSTTPIYLNNPNITGFVLSLNPTTDSTAIVISLDDRQPKDTITFYYTSTKTNLSDLCGDVFFNSITKIKTTNNTIDSIRITNSAVINISRENIRVFF